ncbi:hypothetical protein ACEWY4_026917 [Coilia grayii]|uniref:Ig-like domain-containing protein n=1 Tax=Coilia grayii TaxID=363190 RepID=A0ABD1IR05_9TELE
MKQQRSSFIWLLLCHLIAVRTVEGVTVYGYAGQSVTLPCKYDSQYYGALSICWGKGALPSRGCAEQIIQTDGLKVTARSSPRYQLLNRQSSAGDVSLTIYKAQEKDSGTYGCRVDIPGWFNDEKYHVDLRIKPAPTTTQAPSTLPTTVQTTLATTSTTTLTTTASTEPEWIDTFLETTAEPFTTFTQAATTAETTPWQNTEVPTEAEHTSSETTQVMDLSTAEELDTQTEHPESTVDETSWTDTVSLTTHEVYVSSPSVSHITEMQEKHRVFWWIIPVLAVFVILAVATLVVKKKQLKTGTFTILEKTVNETLSLNSDSSRGPPSSEISMEVMDSSPYHMTDTINNTL